MFNNGQSHNKKINVLAFIFKYKYILIFIMYL